MFCLEFCCVYNVLLPGESLRVNQCLIIEDDNAEWDQATFSINGNCLELYVEKNGHKEIIWTSGELFPSWAGHIVSSLDMLPNGQLNLMYDLSYTPGGVTYTPVSYLYQSFPEYPAFPVPGSYLILEGSLSAKVRLALYSPMQELLWASDSNFRASNVLYPTNTAFGDRSPGVILNLKRDDSECDDLTLEFDGNSLFLFQHNQDHKQLIWQSYEQTCGWGCKGRLGLNYNGVLFTRACFSGTFYYGDPASCLFIDRTPEGKAIVGLYSHKSGVYWTSEMNRMNPDNIRGHFD